jgi:DNA-binding MarR family transcriptional regulator
MASSLKLAKPTVSIGVGQLEEAGFFTRQAHPEDGRAVQLFLTKKGMRLHQKTHQFRCKKFERLLAGLTSKERTALLNLLEKAIQTVEIEEGEVA